MAVGVGGRVARVSIGRCVAVVTGDRVAAGAPEHAASRTAKLASVALTRRHGSVALNACPLLVAAEPEKGRCASDGAHFS